MKLLLALVILIAHIQLFGEYPTVCSIFNKYIFSFALPLFFLFSGYFFTNKVADVSIPWSYSFPKIKRVLILYAVWIIPNLLTVYLRFRGTSIQYILSSVFFSGVYMASWYLNAIIWCMIIVTVISKLAPKLYIYFAILVGLILYLIARGIIPDYINLLQIVTTHSFVGGLIFFSLGALLSKVKIPLLINIPLFFGAFALYMFNIEVILSLILIVFSLGVFLFQYAPSGSVQVGRAFRVSSTIIYLGHPALMIVLRHVVSTNPIVVLIIVLSVLMLLSYLVMHYEKKYPLLAYLY